MTKISFNPLLLVRAEASVDIGTGHVMRMLALAQAWQDAGGSVKFLFAQPNEPMRFRLEQENCAVTVLGQSSASLADARAVAECVQREQPVWLAVDGYDFQREYLDILAATGTPILLATDYALAEYFPVAMILNQNPHAKAADYAAMAPDAQRLLGLRHALLRREFSTWKTCRPKRSGKISQLLITLGGADPDNVTERVVRALAGRLPEGIRVKILLGANNPRGLAVRTAAAQAGPQFECLERVGDMPSLLAKCELAISAGGSTVWEMAFMGVPSLAIILAENQAPLALAVEQLGCGINLGWHNNMDMFALAELVAGLCSDERRVAAMAQRGQALVDGEGAGRVVDCLLQQPAKSSAHKVRVEIISPS